MTGRDGTAASNSSALLLALPTKETPDKCRRCCTAWPGGRRRADDYRDNDRGQEEVRLGSRKAQRILLSEEEHRF